MVKAKGVNPLLIVALVAVAAAAAWLYMRPRSRSLVPLAGVAPTGRVETVDEVPRIALSRLDVKEPPTSAGGTDIFQFGAPSSKETPQANPAAPPPTMAAGAPMPAPVVSHMAPPAPVMNVKYIGTVADKKGLKVAVLMTDRREVLTGRPGDVVANRLKIVSIGIESVDVQDVGSDHVRRIPLRAN
jgi:hypothetical protein